MLKLLDKSEIQRSKNEAETHTFLIAWQKAITKVKEVAPATKEIVKAEIAK